MSHPLLVIPGQAVGVRDLPSAGGDAGAQGGQRTPRRQADVAVGVISVAREVAEPLNCDLDIVPTVSGWPDPGWLIQVE